MKITIKEYQKIRRNLRKYKKQNIITYLNYALSLNEKYFTFSKIWKKARTNYKNYKINKKYKNIKNINIYYLPL